MNPFSVFALYGQRFSSFCFGRISGRLSLVSLAVNACWMTVGLCAMNQGRAQTDWIGDALVQRMPDGQAYLDIQTGWSTTAQTSSDSLVITMIASKNSGVVSFQKDVVAVRPLVLDTTELKHVHVSRLFVPDGRIRIEWQIQYQDSTLWLHNKNVLVPLAGMPEFADPMVVHTSSAAEANSNPDMIHSGLTLIPSIGKHVPRLATSCVIYFEMHGMHDVVPRDSLLLLAYGWTDDSGEWIPEFTKYKRLSSSEVIPVFESLPCSPQVPSPERPILKLEARTRAGDVIVSREVELGTRFSRDDDAVSPSSSLQPLASLLSISEKETLIRHMIDHLPIATTNEQNTIQNTLVPSGSVEQMQQYLTAFWLDRCADVTCANRQHEEYMDRIAVVDEAYGSCKSGQGSLTEMGNVFLRFGKPNTIVKRHHETDYYPYEIWHYHKAGRFNNKRFLFYAPHVVSECFELLHSDMLGERQNEDWLSQLKSRENRLRVTESMENRLNPRDAFSREEPEDLFYNPR